LARVGVIHWRGDRAMALSLCRDDAGDRVGVGNIAGTAQALEPRAPLRRNRLRIAQPILVQLVEISGIAPAELGGFRQLLQQTAAVAHDGHHGRDGLLAQSRRSRAATPNYNGLMLQCGICADCCDPRFRYPAHATPAKARTVPTLPRTAASVPRGGPAHKSSPPPPFRFP